MNMVSNRLDWYKLAVQVVKVQLVKAIAIFDATGNKFRVIETEYLKLSIIYSLAVSMNSLKTQYKITIN